jgi:hypothetical protein
VITGVADRAPARVAQLVYLDTEVPRDGEAEMDLLPPEERAAYEDSARLHGRGWRIRPPLPDPLPADLELVMLLMSPRRANWSICSSASFERPVAAR